MPVDLNSRTTKYQIFEMVNLSEHWEDTSERGDPKKTTTTSSSLSELA